MTKSGADIRDLRKKKGLIQEALADLVGVTKTTVVDWEKDRYFPTGQNLINLARVLEVSVAFLLNEVDDPDIEILKGNFTVGSQALKDSEPVKFPQLLLPIINQEACAGLGFSYEDMDFETVAVDWFPFSTLKLGGATGPKQPYGVMVVGDSMAGVGIHDGYIAVINPNIEPVHGDNVYVRWRGKCSIKGLIEYADKIELRPANPNYQPIWIDKTDCEDLDILGKVVCVFDSRVPKSVI